MRITLLLLVTSLACERAPEPAPAPASTPARAPVPAPAPATPSAPATAPAPALLGAWSADGENFVWLIEPDSILFEADMQRYPYRIAGDTLLIDRSAAAIGMQKTRVLRLSRDTMVIEAVGMGSSEVLLRLR